MITDEEIPVRLRNMQGTENHFSRAKRTLSNLVCHLKKTLKSDLEANAEQSNIS